MISLTRLWRPVLRFVGAITRFKCAGGRPARLRPHLRPFLRASQASCPLWSSKANFRFSKRLQSPFPESNLPYRSQVRQSQWNLAHLDPTAFPPWVPPKFQPNFSLLQGCKVATTVDLLIPAEDSSGLACTFDYYQSYLGAESPFLDLVCPTSQLVYF